MKQDELRTTTEITEFAKKCLTNNDTSMMSCYIPLWEKAKDCEEFKRFCKESKELRMEQAVGELLKDDWSFKRSMLGDECKKTDSDAGGIKVGIKDKFTLIIPNGYGDGVTRYAVLERGEFNTHCFNYFASISGTDISIFSYDCGDDVKETLSGRFHIYYSSGLVIFERLEAINRYSWDYNEHTKSLSIYEIVNGRSYSLADISECENMSEEELDILAQEVYEQHRGKK